MDKFAIALAICLLAASVMLAVLHSKRTGRLSLVDWTTLGLGGVYGGGWALVVFVSSRGDNPRWSPWLAPAEQLYPLHTLASFGLLVSIWLGWFALGPLRVSRRRRSGLPLTKMDLRLRAAMWLLFWAAVAFQWLYTRAYGGFFGVLEHSEAIRSGQFSVHNSLSFLYPFGGLALFASFGFFGLLLNERRPGLVLGFIVSFLFSIYILYSWLGRMGFMIYVATFLLAAMMGRPRPLRLIFRGGVTFLATITGAYQISVWLNLKAADNLMAFAAKELSFPFVSFFAQLQLGEHISRGFVDLMIAPVYVLPSSWWSSWLETVGDINTTVIMGAPKGSDGVTGAIPVDLLTLGLMQASFAGVIVVGLLFGALLRVLQKILDRVESPGVRRVFESYVVLKIAVFAIFYAQPNLFVTGNFAFMVAALCMMFFLRLPLIKLSMILPLHRQNAHGQDFKKA